MTGASERPRNPYVGPRAFEENESQLFFGRDDEIEILTGLVMARRAALLFAPSGAGKSSLLKAGLIPELTRQETVGRGSRARTYQKMRVLPVLTVGGPIPAGMEQPIANLYVLRALLSLQRDTDPEALAGQTLVEALAPFFEQPEPDSQFPDASISPPPTLLIFDQFEEIFTHDPTRRQEREGFFQQVNRALETYPTLHVLFSMREDYIAELTPYTVLLPEQLRPRFRLEFLGEKAALLAIQQPASQAGVEFTAAAAAALALDLRRVRVQRLDGTMEEQVGAYVEPVQLQVVCHRLWQRLPAGATQVVEADVEAVGDVDTALAGYYAERVAAIAAETGVSERAIRDWCDRHLITEQGIRGQVLQGQDESQGLANAAIWPLVDAHLVRAEKRRGATWFELAHDRLIDPVRVDNAAWREANLSPLQRQAALWDDENRPEGLLLRGQALAEAKNWAEAHRDELTHLEQEFIDESVKASRLQSAKRLRVLLLGAAAVVILLATLAILAFLSGEEARRHEATALAAGTAESDAKGTAISAQYQAIIARDDAWAAATAEAESGETAVAAQQTAEEDRYIALTSLANAKAGLNLAQEQLAVADAQLGTIQALEATNQALLDNLAPAPPATPRHSATPTLPGSTQRPTATPTPSAVPTPFPTPTPNLAATAAAKEIQSQLDQVQAMETTIAGCPTEPRGEFQELWQGDEIRLRLGCPKQPEPIRGYWAEQPFENGYMYWSESPDLFVVIIGNDIGQWYLFPTEEITWPSNPSGVSCPADPPRGLYQPVRGFGGLWCANPEIREAIGFATDKERGANGNLLQEFERGLIFRDSQESIYVLFGDDGTYVRDMVFVPGGQLSIGSPQDKGRNVVPVSGFWLDRYEVTNAEYRRCVEDKHCQRPHRENGSPEDRSSTRQDYYTNSRFDRFPVIFMDWNDARAYCSWMGKRLPTEAEWEWAAKGLKNYKFPWGNEPPSASRANYNGRDTRQVGLYDPTVLGLYDLAGNVWEWTSSLAWDYPYDRNDGRENLESAANRVIRGGSWRDGPPNLETTNRNERRPKGSLDNIGFRCAMSPQ